MRRNAYHSKDDFLFSSLFGSAIYSLSENYVQDPLLMSRQDMRQNPLVQDVQTGEEYCIRTFRMNPETEAHYCRLIRYPPDRSLILWPCDCVRLTGEQAQLCSLPVENCYDGKQKSEEENNPCGAVLFPYFAREILIPADKRFEQEQDRTWRNPAVRRLAFSVLTAFERLNRWGYIYLDLHPSRILFGKNDLVVLDFSNLVFMKQEIARRHPCTTLDPSAVPIEFAEPAVIQGTVTQADIRSQNYSLTALLFYMLFHRYPYDGRLLAGHVDNSEHSHLAKFKEYHKLPVFIFDPDDENGIKAMDIFEEDIKLKEVWEQCPQLIRDQFTKVLRQANAERKPSATTCAASPKDWLDLFEQVGWPEQSGEETL